MPQIDFPADIVEQLNAERGPLDAKMGILITEVAPGRLVGTMPVEGNQQPYGLLHGGANAVLAESLGSIGSVVHAPEGHLAVGIELSCTHHRAARAGTVTGVATALSLGRTLAVWEIVITDETGARTCTARLSCLYRQRPPGA